MAVHLNHTIVPVRDKREGAEFIADILGLGPPVAFGPFMCVETANGVSLDYDDRWGSGHHHYAFLVSEEEFDAIFARVKERGIRFWADPGHTQEGHSTTTVGGSISRIPRGTTWRCSPVPYGT